MIPVHRVDAFHAGDLLHADHAFMLGLVRQHGRTGHIADRIQAVHIGASIAVDHHTAPIGLHAEILKAQIFYIALNAHRRDQAIRLDRFGFAVLGLHMGGDSVLVLVDLGDLGAGDDLQPTLFERLASDLGNLRILDRHDLVHQLDHGHIHAHGEIKARELDADRARAHHHEGFGQGLGLHGLKIGPDQLAIGLDPRQGPRTRARGQDDMLGGIRPLAQRVLGRGMLRLHGGPGGFRHLDLARLGQLRLAPDDADLVLLHQHADAAVETRRHLAGSVHDRIHIRLHLPVEHQAIGFGVVGVIEDFRRTQKRLGRNTAPVQADAPEMLALDNSGLEPQLRGPDRGHIAARTRADHDDIKAVFRHGALPEL